MIRLDPQVQPNMVSGVYLKTWTGSVHGTPPTGGGGGSGHVKNVRAIGASLDRVTRPVHLYQTNGGSSGDTPSTLAFSDLLFANWTGTAVTNERAFAADACPCVLMRGISRRCRVQCCSPMPEHRIFGL